jgi:hypothetical protein
VSNNHELDHTLFTKSGKPRKRKPKQKNVYFTEDTQNAILEYIGETDQTKRNIIYNEKIEFAFFKLTQNIINTYKLCTPGNTIEDLQQEVMEHILQKLGLFDPSKGKAYSYFGTIIKRYFIGKNKKTYKSMIDHVDFDNSIVEFSSTYAESFDVEPYDLDTVISEFMTESEKKLPMLFKSSTDISIAKSVLYLFSRIDKLEIINKKAMLLYLREMNPGCDNNQINYVLKQLNSIYKNINLQYISD